MNTSSTTSIITVSNTTTSSYSDSITILETLFYFGSGFTGGILNFIVLYVAFRYIDMEDKPRQIIVVNMTIADFLFCIVYISTRPILTYFPTWSCHAYYVTIWTCQLCSCVNLLWLNLDKLIFIQWPLHYYQVVNRKRIIILSALTWTIIISMSLTVDSFMTVHDSCTAVRLNPTAYMPFLFVYVILILCSFACSGIIYFIAQTTTRMEAVARSQMLRRLLFLFTSTLWTFFTCLPYRALYLYASIFNLREYDFYPIFVDVTTAFFKLLCLGIVFNPIITIVTQYIYRNRVVGIFKKTVGRSPNSEMESMINRRKSTQAILESIPLSSRN